MLDALVATRCAATLSADVRSRVSPLLRPCRKCGESLPVSAFSPDRCAPMGLDSWCRACRAADKRARTASATSARIPWILGLACPHDVATSILGALRLHYGGRPARLLTDLRRTLADDCDAETRVNAMLTLLALREIADAIARPPFDPAMAPEALALLPQAEWEQLVERVESLRRKRKNPPAARSD